MRQDELFETIILHQSGALRPAVARQPLSLLLASGIASNRPTRPRDSV